MSLTPVNNQINRTIKKLNALPKSWRMPVFTFIIGKMVKFAGTASCRVTEINPNRCVVKLANKKKVQNHIGSVHAAGIALLAESATGYLTSLSYLIIAYRLFATYKLTIYAAPQEICKLLPVYLMNKLTLFNKQKKASWKFPSSLPMKVEKKPALPL